MALPKAQSSPQGPAASGESIAGTRDGAELNGYPGRLIAERYRLEALLGKGGMGEVWRASHLVTRRQVALKLMRRAIDHRPEMRRRFLREARAAATVSHENVVEVLDVFEIDDGVPVMVMPLLEGETLASRLSRDGPLSLQAGLEIMLPVIAAVAAAHARRVVHRDLKPDNVFLSRQGAATTVRVLDFGIAKLAQDDPDDPGTLTGTGVLLGTPCYMAPEQAFGERDLDQRVDIWALGAILYETLGGARPIDGENIGQVVRNLMSQGITPLEVLAPEVPAPVREIVMQMLARDRDARPASLEGVFTLLTDYAPEARRSALAELWARGAAESSSDLEFESPSVPVAESGVPETSLTSTLASEPPRPISGRHLVLGVGLALAASAATWLATRASTPDRVARPAPSGAVAAPSMVAAPKAAASAAAPTVSASAEPEFVRSAAASASSPPRERPAPVRQARPPLSGAEPKPPVAPPSGLQEELPF